MYILTTTVDFNARNVCYVCELYLKTVIIKILYSISHYNNSFFFLFALYHNHNILVFSAFDSKLETKVHYTYLVNSRIESFLKKVVHKGISPAEFYCNKSWGNPVNITVI